MTGYKRSGYRVISLITIVMLILTGIPIVGNTELTVKALKELEISSFTIGFADGAVLTDGKYVWTAPYADPGHPFVYRINYSLSGEGVLEAGEVELRLPRRLLKDRRGRYADEIELSIPSKQELEDYDGDLAEIDTSFVYEIDGDEIRIYNYHDGNNGEKLKAGATGYIEVGYRMIYQTYEYADMAPSDTFWASLTLYDSGDDHAVIEQQRSEAPCVYINTYANLVSTTKRCLNLRYPYTSWQSEWGTAPENADDYYYLVWELRSYISEVTQPYTFTITDVIDEPGAEPIAYRLWGTNSYQPRNYQTNLTAERFLRYDYVITRHLKATYEPLDRYTITNTETASVTPKDQVDATTSASSSDKFTYIRKPYGGPGGYFWHRKSGNNNWWEHFGYRWEIADYGLQDLRDGVVDYLSGNIKFLVETSGYGYRYTLAEGASAQELDQYGKRNVTYTLTDEKFYFNDNIEETEDGRVIIGEDERPLTWEDFSVEYADYTVDISDAEFDEQDQDFVSKTVTWLPEDILYFYGKFGDSDEWIAVGSYDLYLNKAEYDHQYVTDLTNTRITFADNCVGYRIEIANPHFATAIRATPFCRVKNSPYIMGQVGDDSVEKVWLTNVSDYQVHDDKGKLLHNSLRMARDFIIGVEKISEFEKRVITTRSNPLKRIVTIGWKISMSEYYIDNEGIQYIQQDSGTFYDLLPIGCSVDLSTVAVSTGEGDYHFLDKNAYTVSVEDNYNNSGRTMLKVFVKDQFSRAIVTYNTVYTWDSAIEYGLCLHNTVAYETGNERMTGGRPDNGGDIHDSELMKNLDPESTGDRFIYIEHDCQLRFLVASFTGLYKKVKNPDDVVYSDETTTRQNRLYSYKLRYSTTAISRAKNMIFFDSLENYSFTDPDTKEFHSPQWHGTISSVDLSQARDEMGIAPVVYYYVGDSSLNLEAHHDLEELQDGSRIWIPAEEVSDLSTVKAVAVDLRHDADGNDYVLDYSSAVSVTLYMRAPAEDNSGSSDPVTFNNIYMDNTVIDLLEQESPYFIHQEYTTVHFRIASDLNILKVSSKDNTTPVKDIEFTLSGTSKYGTVVNEVIKSDKYGHINFTNIEKGEYTLTETAGSVDYLQNIDSAAVVIDQRGIVTVNGQPVAEGVYYEIKDDPRIHTDIEFFKRNIANKKMLVSGIPFELKGRSDYGTDIDQIVHSDDSGKVVFRNIEKGNYELFEPDGEPTNGDFIRQGVIYTVRVDPEGHFTITSPDSTFTAEEELNGTISIYNEPYHSFTLQKEGTIKIDGDALPVAGATYHFWGTSSYGTEVDRTQTTQSNGRTTFSRLEAGTYKLQEAEAPTGYELDPTVYLVEITPEDEITITGNGRIISRNNMGYYVFVDQENSVVVITKKWKDNDESRAKRLSDGLEAVIHISTEPKKSEAYFAGSISDNWIYATPISKITTNLAEIKTFQHYTGEDSDVQALINSGTAKRLDDGTTDYVIYGWKDNDGNIYWWSNAKKVYLKNLTRYLFRGLSSLKKLDFSDIDTSKMTDMSLLFAGLNALTDLKIDNINSSNVTNMHMMFSGCSSMTDFDLSLLDTAKVTDMSGMFYYCRKVKEIDLSVLDGSSNLSMGQMFYWCENLERVHFGSFNTSKVKSFYSLFDGAFKIKYIDAENIDTSSATNMHCMFNYCYELENLDVSHFNTDNVTNMAYMFMQCVKLNALDVSGFKTGNVKKMEYMFAGCRKIQTLDVSGFDTQNVTNMECMFAAPDEGSNLRYMDLQNLDVSGFVTSKVTSMASMFYHCPNLSVINVSNWDTSLVKNMAHLFDGCTSVKELNVSNFDTKSVTNMAYMFNGCSSVKELNVTGWNTEKCTNMNAMFSGCASLDGLDVNNFNTTNVTNMRHMFSSCSSLTSLDLSSFNTGSVLNTAYMFWHCSSLKDLDISNFSTENVTNMEQMFSGCSSLTSIVVSSFNTEKVVNMQHMFSACNSLKTLDLQSFDTKLVNNMECMFWKCNSLTSLDVSSFDTSNVTLMNNMFASCYQLKTLDLSHFNTSSVTNVSSMFSECSNLVTLNISGFDLSKCANTQYMFTSCTKLKYLTLTNVNTKNVGNMHYMFKNCSSLEVVDLSSFDTSSCTNIGYMFENCSSLKTVDLSSFDTKNVVSMQCMFYNCSSLETVYASDLWTTTKVTASANVFYNCGSITGGQGTTFSADSITYARIDNPPDAPGYFTYKAAPSSSGSGAATVTRIKTTSSSAGVSYVSTGDNCKVTKIDDDTYEYTFTGLDPTLQFYAWEEEMGGYTSLNMGEVNHLTVVEGKGTIINTVKDNPPQEPQYGSLTLTKTVEKEDGTELSSDDSSRRFTFTLLLFDENGEPVTKTALFGEIPYGRNGAVLTLAHNESVTLSGIPAEYRYKLTEQPEEGFVSAVTEGEAEGSISADNTVSVTYTNTIPIEKLTSFRLKKQVNGRFELNDEEYEFKISFTGLKSKTVYHITGDRTFDFTSDSHGGKLVSFSLRDSETVTVNNIPVGSFYQVIEAPGDYTSAYEITNNSSLGAISQSNGSTMNKKYTELSTQAEKADEGEDILVTFTNTKDVRQDLTLRKETDNTDNNDQFTFEVNFLHLSERETIEIEQHSISGVTMYRETADELGKLEGLTVYLRAGEYIVFKQLPVGTKYQITEQGSHYRASYTLTDSGSRDGKAILSAAGANSLSQQPLTTGVANQSGSYTEEGMETVNEGEEVTVTFINTKLQHDISVTKRLDMTYSNLSYAEYSRMKFNLQLDLSGLDESQPYTVEYTADNTTGILKTETIRAEADGTLHYTAVLQQNQTCHLLNLPENARYTVTEPAMAFYQAEYQITGNDAAVIQQASFANTKTNTELATAEETVDANDLDINIVFTNHYRASDYVLPAAGTSDIRRIMLMLLSGMMLFGAVFWYVNRKRT